MTMATQEYVVGFLLDCDGRVALIRKNRPAWQQGRLNGIGGHVEEGESADAAMRREFAEETGTDIDGWQQFVRMRFPSAGITFYRRWAEPFVLDELRTMTDERVALAPVANINDFLIIPNLAWLVPLAAYTADQYEQIVVDAHVSKSVDQTGPCDMRQGTHSDFARCHTHGEKVPFGSVCAMQRLYLEREAATCALTGDQHGQQHALNALTRDARAQGEVKWHSHEMGLRASRTNSVGQR